MYDTFVAKVSELYEAEKVKNGVFQAMMEVGLVNDGPVGVPAIDYRCDNEAVISSSATKCLGTDRWHMQVTLEIQTNPPRKEEKKAKEGGIVEIRKEGRVESMYEKIAAQLPQELLD